MARTRLNAFRHPAILHKQFIIITIITIIIITLSQKLFVVLSVLLLKGIRLTLDSACLIAFFHLLIIRLPLVSVLIEF